VVRIPAAQAVEELVHQYYKLVFHTIYGLTNNWEESQDLTQDTFQQALKGIDAARANSGDDFHAKAWLLRIALNTVRMQRRRQTIFSFVPFSTMRGKRGQDTDGKESDTIGELATPVQPVGYGPGRTEDPATLIAEQDAVQRTMARLPEPLRVCLLLSIVAGLASSEIASLLGIKEAAVRQRIARARKQFQQTYEQESGEEVFDATHSAHELHNNAHQNGKEQTRRQTPADTSQSLSLTALPLTMRRSYV
jgi:RNA polymerase sigma-70 factor (ECF subfamily)